MHKEKNMIRMRMHKIKRKIVGLAYDLEKEKKRGYAAGRCCHIGDKDN